MTLALMVCASTLSIEEGQQNEGTNGNIYLGCLIIQVRRGPTLILHV